MKARVTVTLKQSVLDPQGQAIQHALMGLGFLNVNSVRQGKVFDLDLKTMDEKEAHKDIVAMCEKLLVNGVIENYDIKIL